MNIDEIIQQPGQRERIQKENILKSVHVAVPGEVLSYNPENRTAAIQPVIREWNRTEKPPILLDVPVFMWGNFTFEPQEGDGCLVVFADSCIDAWIGSNGVKSPVVYRMHSLSDGFAFVGFNQEEGTNLMGALNGKVDKVNGETENIVVFGEDGAIADSGKKISDFPAKVVGTVGNFMQFGENGSIADSQKSASSFIAKVTGTVGNFVQFGQDGSVSDSGKKASDFLPSDTAVPVNKGGTGADTASGARTNLGLGSAATKDVVNNLTTSQEGYVLDARQGKKLADAIGYFNEVAQRGNYSEFTVTVPWVSGASNYAIILGFKCMYYLLLDSNGTTTILSKVFDDYNTTVTVTRPETNKIKITFNNTQWGGIRILYLG